MKKNKAPLFLSIVIPCYNEEANLKRGVLRQVYDYLKKQKYSWEVIISDDGSIDKSREMAENFTKGHPNFKLLKNQHGGKPCAVWQGIKKAKGEIVLFADMDQSTPINQVERLLPLFNKNYDVVIGSRGWKRKGAPFYRQIAGWIFSNGRKLFLLPNIVDTQCGFKAFKTTIAKELFPKLSVLKDFKQATGWRVTAFDVELLFLAQKKGYKIIEVLTKWRDEDIATGKNKSFIKESRQMLEQIINVRKNDWQGRYE